MEYKGGLRLPGFGLRLPGSGFRVPPSALAMDFVEVLLVDF